MGFLSGAAGAVVHAVTLRPSQQKMTFPFLKGPNVMNSSSRLSLNCLTSRP